MTKQERRSRLVKAFGILDRIDKLSKKFGEEINAILKDEISVRGNTQISAELEYAIKMAESCITQTDAAGEALVSAIGIWGNEDEYGESLV